MDNLERCRTTLHGFQSLLVDIRAFQCVHLYKVDHSDEGRGATDKEEQRT